MGQDHIAVVRASFDAWNAGDMDRVREIHHPSGIICAPPGWPEPGPEVGRDAVMAQFERLRTAFRNDSVRVLSDFESVGDRVAVRISWDGAGQGPVSSMEMTVLATVRDGQLFFVEYLWDHEAARAALGL